MSEGRQLKPAPEESPDRIDVVWDEVKHGSNRAEHDISFHEAAAVFSDPLAAVIDDPDHSFDERRFLIVGESGAGHLLVVSYTERGGKIRIISARRATPMERRNYEEGGR
ncbi:MAG TPA: BrnT family toxin [Pyrinomonadaceae bacterium]|nr:BrnT family toxin [Pyrinomonadaceae bacterium]